MKQFWQFIFLVLLLSIPFWILGAFAQEFTNNNPMKLPISALMTFCPLIAAVTLTKRKYISEVLKLSFDFKKIKNKIWLIPILFLMPAIALTSYFLNQFNHAKNVSTDFSWLEIVIFFILYFIGAIGEEVGWSGYAAELLQSKFGALKAGIFLGLVWAIWHLIPYVQMGKPAEWILWKSICTILLRVIMFWIFNNSNKSVFAIILFHTMINVSPYLIPNNGVDYNPIVLALSLFISTLVILFFWGPKSMTNYRFRGINSANRIC